MTLQAQGSSQLINFQLNMGARDKSFMNRVSSLAKWLFQSIIAFIIFKLMHSFSNQRFMQKSVTNASRSLTIKVYTTHRFMANDYLHNLSIKPTNIFSHSPNSCSFSSNYCILIQSKWSTHHNSLNPCNRSIQIIHKHKIFKSNKTMQ